MDTINVYCVNTGQNYSVPLGITYSDFATTVLGEDLKIKPVAALFDNNLQALQYRMFKDGRLEFVDETSQDGYSVIMRSLIFSVYSTSWAAALSRTSQ